MWILALPKKHTIAENSSELEPSKRGRPPLTMPPLRPESRLRDDARQALKRKRSNLSASSANQEAPRRRYNRMAYGVALRGIDQGFLPSSTRKPKHTAHHKERLWRVRPEHSRMLRLRVAYILSLMSDQATRKRATATVHCFGGNSDCGGEICFGLDKSWVERWAGCCPSFGAGTWIGLLAAGGGEVF